MLTQKESEAEAHYCRYEDRIISMSQKVDDIHKILLGNGRPDKGLLFRVEMNSQHREASNKILWAMFFVVLASLVPNIIKAVEGVVRHTSGG